MNKTILSGNWKLKLDQEKQGIAKKYYESLETVETIELPGTVSQQKKSPLTDEKAEGYLTDPYKYEGWAWYEKEIDLSKACVNNFRLLLERTRYSTVWVNGKEAGTNNSINGKQVFDFSLTTDEIKRPVKITVLISNVDYIVPGGHMTSADTQTNWNGITGEISIEELNSDRLENIKLTATFNNNLGNLIIEGNFTGSSKTEAKITIEGITEVTEQLQPGKNKITLENLKVEGWEETNPKLYELKIEQGGQTPLFTQFKIGFRTFKTNGKYFECNGKKVFLRGKHDGMIFPETGFAPTTVEEWKTVLTTAKNYGINHYRFHTCCPPEAAFTAADELGIYMSPELPFWGTIQAPGEEGFNQEQQDYLISEGYKILDNFGNHPSFVMMSMGNELWGSEKRLDEIMKAYHEYDSRHLYTGGSNNFQFWPRTTENEDYFVGVRFAQDALIRGSYAQCDAPLGFVQTDVPNANHNYDVFFGAADSNTAGSGEEKEIEIQYGTGVKKVKAGGDAGHFIPNKPCISHEVGQYCMYPNFEENQHFTGVLKPYNFEIFQNRLEKAGMKNKAADFFRDSSRLAVQCYKTEIEAALRSNELSGFQLLDIQDFTGQGTAVVGVLNAFMESKGIVTGEQWRSFCDKTVLLASFDKFVYKNKDSFSADLILHNYSENDYSGQFVTAFVINTENDEILCEEQFLISNPKDEKNFRGNIKLGTFKYDFENVKKYQKLCLLLVLNPDEEGTESIINSYTLHVYPEQDEQIAEALQQLSEKNTVELDNAILTKDKTVSSKTKKVIYFPTEFEGVQTVHGTYCTDFWCYPMFRSISESMKKQVPTGTLGLTIKTDAKELKLFPTDSYTTPKWYNIISHAECVNLGDSKIEPIVQMIDNFERNWKLGILYEQEGKIICTSRLWEIATEPEVHLFIKSLIN